MIDSELLIGLLAGLGGLIFGAVGAITGVFGVAVSIYNARGNAKKTEVDILRGTLAELRTDLECEKADNLALRDRVILLEAEKEACRKLLETANRNLEKFTRAITKREKLELVA